MTWLRFYAVAFAVALAVTLWLIVMGNPLSIMSGFTALVLIGCMLEEI
jgi:hypothetical protein